MRERGSSITALEQDSTEKIDSIIGAGGKEY